MPSTSTTYFEQRIFETLGLTKEYLTLSLGEEENTTGEIYTSLKRPVEVIDEDQDGNIVMYPFSLDGKLISYDSVDRKNAKPVRFAYVRFNGNKPLPTDKDGEPIKARPLNTKGGTHPFLGPNFYRHLVNLQRSNLDGKKSKVKRKLLPTNTKWDGVLYFTEGYLKAVKADFHGCPMIGLSSISHYRQTKGDDKGKPYQIVAEIIKLLKPKKIVLLHDADVFKMKYKDPLAHSDSKSADMTRRLWSFCNSVIGFADTYRKLCKNIHYSHIHPRYDAPDNAAVDAKGIDDLLVKFKGKEAELLEDLAKFEDDDQNHFISFKVSKQDYKVQDYFLLRDKRLFYQRFEKIIGSKKFIYRGALFYRTDTEEGNWQLIEARSAEADQFLCIGNSYYEKVKKPKYWGTVDGVVRWEMVDDLEQRSPDIIKKRFPEQKKILEAIAAQYYTDFFCEPGHLGEFRQARGKSYNTYKKISHEPEAFSIPADYQYDQLPQIAYSIKMLQQIFGKHEEKGKLGDPLELALDYVSLLFRKPTEKLPILAMISEANKTGKTTFMDWLLAIFEKNAQYGTSSSFTEKFNIDWIASILVLIDEAIVDKGPTMQKVKMMSTAKTMKFEIKNGAAGNVNVFFKLIMTSNSYDFLKLEQQETRFWALTVPELPKEDRDPNFMGRLLQEIPNFIYFILTRDILHPKKDRMWFDEEHIKNPTLEKIKARSKSWDRQTLEDIIVAIFETESFAKIKEIHLTINQLHKLMKIYGGDRSMTLNSTRHILQSKMSMNVKRGRIFPILFSDEDRDNMIFTQSAETVTQRYYTFKRENFDSMIWKDQEVQEVLPF